MADFLYGKLNKEIEYLRYKFTNTDTVTLVEDDNHNLQANVNVENLVRLLQVKNDNNPEDDHIKYYKLFIKDPETGEFTKELPNSATITVGEGSGVDFGNLTSIMINGVSVKGEIDSITGQLKLEALPASVITDVSHKDEEGNNIYIESTLDGNAGGEVY